MKVYVVTTGVYSSTSIVAAFSMEDDAKAAAAKLDDGDVTALELDEFRGDIVPADLQRWSVHITFAGDVVYASQRSAPRRLDEGTTVMRQFDWVNGQQIWRDVLFVECWARDEEHATKIANEKRVEWMVKRRLMSDAWT